MAGYCWNGYSSLSFSRGNKGRVTLEGDEEGPRKARGHKTKRGRGGSANNICVAAAVQKKIETQDYKQLPTFPFQLFTYVKAIFFFLKKTKRCIVSVSEDSGHVTIILLPWPEITVGIHFILGHAHEISRSIYDTTSQWGMGEMPFKTTWPTRGRKSPFFKIRESNFKIL